MNTYQPPEFLATAFNCPCCGAYAQQDWFDLQLRKGGTVVSLSGSSMEDFQGSRCSCCKQAAIWLKMNLVFPNVGPAALANPDMTEDIKADYEEANTIANASPRGAAALLRLAIQKLCKHLGKPGKNINQDVAALVADGLPPKMQQALDSVRVIGNESVHPGTLDLRDDPTTAAQLFRLTNFIVQKMISEPKEIDGVYSSLPERKREEIERRDNRAP